ncbi:hypothetical protein [Oryzicola mucosus]|uniref:hypothetical protein n=1 Tax=Oryzicola mucosus TaxID=2767425 RepID=UPI001E5BE8A3|nr:hypothetical protein [Oryzicola mucosus]
MRTRVDRYHIRAFDIIDGRHLRHSGIYAPDGCRLSKILVPHAERRTLSIESLPTAKCHRMALLQIAELVAAHRNTL